MYTTSSSFKKKAASQSNLRLFCPVTNDKGHASIPPPSPNKRINKSPQASAALHVIEEETWGQFTQLDLADELLEKKTDSLKALNMQKELVLRAALASVNEALLKASNKTIEESETKDSLSYSP